VRITLEGSCTSKAREFMTRRMSVGPVAIHPTELGSSPPSIGQDRDRRRQRRRVDRTCGPHPRSGGKLNLDRSGTGQTGWCSFRRDSHRRKAQW
jgi:hypothetical protein